MALPLKNCDQCSHYRGGYCYGFGTARKVISKSEAILCGNYTPLGQVQIGPIDSLGGQLKEYQLPSGIISTVKLADLAVTLAKLSASSVNDSKVVPSAGIVESKLNLDFGTSALDTLISANAVDIASNLALILLREESANKGVASGYCDLDAGVHIPLTRLADLTNTQLADAAAIIESKLNLDFSTQSLHDDIQTRALAATYLAHDHSLADPTQVDFNNLLNISPLVLAGDLEVLGGTATVSGPVETKRGTMLQTAGSNRIALIVNDTAETGGSYGSNFTIEAYADNGLYLWDLLRIYRATKNVWIAGNLTLLSGKTVDGVDVGEEPARISTEIDTDITTHAGIATAHQDAPALITTHAGIATAHQDAPALITTHAGIASAHQDAPALITTHAGIASAHHTAYTDAMALAAVDEHLVIGSDNAVWINCPYEGSEFVDGDKMRYDGSMEAYYVSGAARYVYSVPLPTTRGGKSLYINGTRVSLSAASGSNRVYETNLYGMGDTTATELDSDETNKNSVNLWEDVSMGNTNLGGYDVAKVILKTAIATAGNLKVQYVTVRYYYA